MATKMGGAENISRGDHNFFLLERVKALWELCFAANIFLGSMIATNLESTEKRFAVLNPTMRLPALILAFMALIALVAPAHADITGRARVIDGDTIEIRHQRIRLFGIDAPESRQRCAVSGKPWRCGQQATFMLAEFIGKAWVRCVGKDRDRYKRIVAVCYVGNKNINAWMVRQGWAVDYRRYSKGAYRTEQLQAKREKVGIWRGTFKMPWKWRQNRRGRRN